MLAFAQREGEAGRLHPEVLGDIIISVPTATRQAGAASPPKCCTSPPTGSATCSATTTATTPRSSVMNARAAALRREGRRTGRVRAA